MDDRRALGAEDPDERGHRPKVAERVDPPGHRIPVVTEIIARERACDRRLGADGTHVEAPPQGAHQAEARIDIGAADEAHGQLRGWRDGRMSIDQAPLDRPDHSPPQI